MVLGNKAIAYRADLHLSTILFQNAIAVAMLASVTRQDHRLERTCSAFAQAFGVALLLTVMLVSSLTSLKYVGVTSVVLMKNLSTAGTVLGEWVFFGRKILLSTLLAGSVMLTASLLYCKFDVQFSSEGYFWIAVNILATSSYALSMQYVITCSRVSKQCLLFHTNLLSLPVLALAIASRGELPILFASLANLTPAFVGIQVVVAVIGGLLGYVSMWTIECLGAGTFAVLGTMNKVPLVILGATIFGDSFSFESAIFCALGIVAGTVFAIGNAVPNAKWLRMLPVVLYVGAVTAVFFSIQKDFLFGSRVFVRQEFWDRETAQQSGSPPLPLGVANLSSVGVTSAVDMYEHANAFTHASGAMSTSQALMNASDASSTVEVTVDAFRSQSPAEFEHSNVFTNASDAELKHSNAFINVSDASIVFQQQPAHDRTLQPVGPPHMDSTLPWSMTWLDGGSLRVQSSCPAEVDKFCQTKLPLLACIHAVEQTSLSPGCFKAVNPCLNRLDRACASLPYRAMQEQDWTAVFELLAIVDAAAAAVNATYWMVAATAIGGLVHHGPIPWDDDADLLVLEEDLQRLLLELTHVPGIKVVEHPNLPGGLWKISSASTPRVGTREWGFPFLDLFPVRCPKSRTGTCSEVGEPKPATNSRADWVFPLVRRPFGPLSLPFPRKLEELVKRRYGSNVQDICAKKDYNHRLELHQKNREFKAKCSALHFVPTIVRRRTVEGDVGVSVEHAMDGDTRIFSVVFDRGQEVRRSFADGLIGANGTISITMPSPLESARPIPFLPEERKSYLRNAAGRSALDLNKEVQPMLARVEVSNKHPGTPPSRSLIVTEWNAERGKDFLTFATELSPEANVIILNEMDWGMARSGNVHTTRLLAEALQMNFAWAVEFMELTNGNEGEIRKTAGMTNTVGYHGNAVLSKWPIIKTSVLKLQQSEPPAMLFAAKQQGKAQGERRLGCRMALFVLIKIGATNLLAISAHGSLKHGKSNDAVSDADTKAICEEVHLFNTSAVILGGDMINIGERLKRQCGFMDPHVSNSHSGKGQFTPSLRKDPRRPANGRGDWVFVRGLDVDPRSLQTLLAAKKSGHGELTGLSDHDMLKLRATLPSSPEVSRHRG